MLLQNLDFRDGKYQTSSTRFSFLMFLIEANIKFLTFNITLPSVCGYPSFI